MSIYKLLITASLFVMLGFTSGCELFVEEEAAEPVAGEVVEEVVEESTYIPLSERGGDGGGWSG